jgi:membrane-associated phospholipid phosphatase
MASRERRRAAPTTPQHAGARLLYVGAALTAAVVVPRSRAAVQRLDNGWYRLVQEHRRAPLTAASRVLDVALGTTVDWTVRVGVTAVLVRQRRWRALASWTATIALGEVSIGPVKARIDRLRPPDPLVRTSMTSYPSGHAIAAATTCSGIVLALLPPGPGRERWLDVATAIAAATALSRTYLNAHWLSDSVGGFCLGSGYSLVAPRVVDSAIDLVQSCRR